VKERTCASRKVAAPSVPEFIPTTASHSWATAGGHRATSGSGSVTLAKNSSTATTPTESFCKSVVVFASSPVAFFRVFGVAGYRQTTGRTDILQELVNAII